MFGSESFEVSFTFFLCRRSIEVLAVCTSGVEEVREPDIVGQRHVYGCVGMSVWGVICNWR